MTLAIRHSTLHLHRRLENGTCFLHIRGTLRFVKEILNDLSILMSRDTGCHLIYSLAFNSKRAWIVIEEDPDSPSSYAYEKGPLIYCIKITATQHFDFIETQHGIQCSKTPTPSHITLGHECIHIFRLLTGTSKHHRPSNSTHPERESCMYRYTNREEFETIGSPSDPLSENKLRAEHGLCPRIFHQCWRMTHPAHRIPLFELRLLPLQKAIFERDASKISHLLESGHDPFEKGVEDISPLQDAFHLGTQEVLEVLFNHIDTLPKNFIDGAIVSHKWDLLRILIRYADKFPYLKNSHLFLWIICYAPSDLVLKFIQAKANMYGISHQFMTALDLAFLTKDPKKIKYVSQKLVPSEETAASSSCELEKEKVVHFLSHDQRQHALDYIIAVVKERGYFPGFHSLISSIRKTYPQHIYIMIQIAIYTIGKFHCQLGKTSEHFNDFELSWLFRLFSNIEINAYLNLLNEQVTLDEGELDPAFASIYPRFIKFLRILRISALPFNVRY